MNTTDETNGMAEFNQRRLEALADIGRASNGQYQRAREVLGRNFFGRHINQIVPLDSEFGDTYIIEARKGNDRPWWIVVLDGKRVTESSFTFDEALLIYLAAKHGDAVAALYAARVLNLPEQAD